MRIHPINIEQAPSHVTQESHALSFAMQMRRVFRRKSIAHPDRHVIFSVYLQITAIEMFARVQNLIVKIVLNVIFYAKERLEMIIHVKMPHSIGQTMISILLHAMEGNLVMD